MYVMSSVCCYVGVIVPQWRRTSMQESKNFHFLLFLLHTKKKISPFRVSSSFSDDHVPSPIQTQVLQSFNECVSVCVVLSLSAPVYVLES